MSILLIPHPCLSSVVTFKIYLTLFFKSRREIHITKKVKKKDIILLMIENMTSTQKKAFNIYIESATMDNEFTPMSDNSIVKKLVNDGVEGVSKASMQRWRTKFQWKEHLELKVSSVMVKDENARELIVKSSTSAATQAVMDDFKVNEEIKDNAYMMIKQQMQKYKIIFDEGGFLGKDDFSQLLKILELTTGREDKLLDRQTLLTATKFVSSDSVFALLNNISLEIEDEEDIIDGELFTLDSGRDDDE